MHKNEKDINKLIERINEAIFQVSLNQNFKTLFFIDVILLKELNNELKNIKNIDIIKYSKISNSKRSYLTITNSKNDLDLTEYTTLVKIEYNNKFKQINHNDVLGTLYSHNIKKEFIGSIIVYNNNIYFEIVSNLYNYVVQNIEKINNTKVNLVKSNDIVYEEDNLKKYHTTIKSTRLDVIIKAITNLSREQAKNYILENNIKVNQISTDNYSRVCKNEDVISIRKYGRFIVKFDCNKLTKKGNINLDYYKYI
ncbi:YlmH/Sll1252 family protein [Mycoplasma sp. P36-A1]|uniref:YlmH/Sll1252 family protein n=1 Tax=Mycoplasma sp. P36-A1 TaxID=3252900 RepID=UPI003C2F4415